MSDSVVVNGMIRTVPSYIFIQILRDLKKSCRMCMFQRADLLYLNDLEDCEDYDRCKGCNIPPLRDKILLQFKNSYHLDEKKINADKNNLSMMTYL